MANPMREFRLGYSSPRCPDRGSEHGDISTRVDVGVGRVATRTGKSMLIPFSNSPAHRACLARVGRVNKCHAQPRGFGFVSNKVLQLPESPAMQPRPDALSGLDVGANIGQVFHADFACAGAHRFRDDGLADFVVDVLNMPILTPGDSLEFALGGAATFGLETTAMGKVNVPVVPEFTAAPDLASAGGSEVVFAHVNPENAATGNLRSVWKVEDEVEIPDVLTNDELSFFGGSVRKQIALVFAADERNLDATGQGEQRKRVALDRVGALVEVDGRWAESDCGNRFVLGDTIVGFERLVGIGDAVDSLARHLASERVEPLADGVVGQVVQCDTIPATMLLNKRDNGFARTSISIGERRQCRDLLGGNGEFERYSPFHIGYSISTKDSCQERSAGTGAAYAAALSLPGLKAGVSRAI